MGGAAPERPLAVTRGGDGAERTLTRPGALHPLYRRLKTELDSGAGLILILDFDGTLVPIVRRPAAARLNPSVRRTLRRLAAYPRVGLAILSGRALADIKRRVGLQGIVYGGCHGLELEGPGFRVRSPLVSSVHSRVGTVATALREASSLFPGAEVEDKGLSAAVHYRRVSPARARALKGVVERVAARMGLAVLPGKRVWDLVPGGLRGKSNAVRRIRSHLRNTMGDRVPLTVYAGDDVTDAEAFGSLGPRGVSILVGRMRAEADYRVRDVRQLHGMLRWIAKTLGSAPRLTTSGG